MDSWLDEIEKNCNKKEYKILIGNKYDLEDKRKVSYQEAKDFATNKGMKYIETSAKTDYKVKEAFELISQDLIDVLINEKREKEEKERKRKEDYINNLPHTDYKKTGGCSWHCPPHCGH